jgi:hypothetical protein
MLVLVLLHQTGGSLSAFQSSSYKVAPTTVCLSQSSGENSVLSATSIAPGIIYLISHYNSQHLFASPQASSSLTCWKGQGI